MEVARSRIVADEKTSRISGSGFVAIIGANSRKTSARSAMLSDSTRRRKRGIMSNGSNRPAPLWSRRVTDSRNKSIFLDIYSGQYGPYLVIVDSVRNRDTGEYERVRTMHSPEMTEQLAFAFAEAVGYFKSENPSAPASPPATPPARSATPRPSAPRPATPPARQKGAPPSDW
jgi:hypothetical protein